MSTLENRKILIVDDEPMLREILRDVLEFEGATIHEAENGRQAFDLHQREKFDAVISDIRMPGGDGLELLMSLRNVDCCTPVVMLITGFSDLSHDAAYSLGADAVLSKPFDVNELLGRLGFLLAPAEKRLSESFEIASSRKIEGKDLNPKLGRGGFFVPDCVDGVTGEVISFGLDSHELGGAIQGKGIIRWIRRTVADDRSKGMGVEFRYLEPESLKRVLDWNARNKVQAFIPDGK